MEILVCLKEGRTPGEMARLDALALETALVLKESAPDPSVIQVRAICMDRGADSLLRRALGMGADGVLGLTLPPGDPGGLNVARALAAEAGNARLILT